MSPYYSGILFMADHLLDVTEAAKVLGLPKSWIYARVESPECDLPFFRVGRYIKFKASELAAYLERNRGGPRPS